MSASREMSASLMAEPAEMVAVNSGMTSSVAAAALLEANYSTRSDGFCTSHLCDRETEGCCQQPCTQPSDSTPHFVYVHVPKTGGSSIECAWQEAREQGLVDLMGHAAEAAVAACEERCHVPTARLLSVRDPFAFWVSCFEYAWKCIDLRCVSVESGKLKQDPASGVRYDPASGNG
ncbi:hypothetical protein OAO87_01960 [bacterium]|nr:hypothetical protein [bacterium]